MSASDYRQTVDTLEHNLTNHPPKSERIIQAFESIRLDAKVLGYRIASECPSNRERSLALTNLEQAVMWAIAAVARHQDRDTPTRPACAEEES